MSVSINTVGNRGGGGLDPSAMASKIATRMMSDLDPGNTGKVTKDQFISGMTAKGVSSADATKMYDAIDTKNTGSIGKSDIEAAIRNGNLKPPAGGPPGGHRRPGGHGAGAGKPEGGGSTSTTYAAADTNQDGVVSVQEAAVYAMKHPSVLTGGSTATDSTRLGKNVDKRV